MSGGSLDYFYFKVSEMAAQLDDKSNTPLQRAFAKHLYKVSDALHNIELVMSGDKGNGDDDESIKAVLGQSANSQAFSVLQEDCEKLIEQLKKFSAKE